MDYHGNQLNCSCDDSSLELVVDNGWIKQIKGGMLYYHIYVFVGCALFMVIFRIVGLFVYKFGYVEKEIYFEIVVAKVIVYIDQ